MYLLIFCNIVRNIFPFQKENHAQNYIASLQADYIKHYIATGGNSKMQTHFVSLTIPDESTLE